MTKDKIKIEVNPEVRYRVAIFRSNKSISGQIIDDANGLTLAAIQSESGAKASKPVELSMKAGEALGAKAIKLGVKKLKYDRNGYKYHGRVKSFAEGLRKAGLEL